MIIRYDKILSKYFELVYKQINREYISTSEKSRGYTYNFIDESRV